MAGLLCGLGRRWEGDGVLVSFLKFKRGGCIYGIKGGSGSVQSMPWATDIGVDLLGLAAQVVVVRCSNCSKSKIRNDGLNLVLFS